MPGAWRSSHGWPSPRIFLISGNRGHSIWIDLNDWRGFFSTGRGPTHVATQYGSGGLGRRGAGPVVPGVWRSIGQAGVPSGSHQPPRSRGRSSDGCMARRLRLQAPFCRLMLRRRMHARKLSCFTWIDLNSRGAGSGAMERGPQPRAAIAPTRLPSHQGVRDHAQVPPRSLPCLSLLWTSVFPSRTPASFLIPALSPPSLTGWAGHQRPGFGRATLSPYRHRPTGSSS